MAFTTEIVLDNLRVDEREGTTITSMRVDRGERLVLRRHEASAADVDNTATPFVALAAFLASVLGRDLRVDGPVDTVAADNARAAGALLGEWFGWHVPEIRAAAPAPVAAPAGAVALFFSRGLDAMTTLIEQRDRIGVLYGMDWQDPPLATEGTAQIWRGTQAAADDARLPLVRLSTNSRAFLDPVVAWDLSHGVVLAALAQLAAPAAGEAIISGAHPAGEEKPHGNHPDLDVLWSSSRVRTSYACGPQGGRNAKAALAGADPFACRWLKVCWERAGDGNCGRCSKCLMTMTNFRIAGCLDAVAARFDAPLTPEAILAVEGEARVSPHNTRSLIEGLAQDDPLLEPWKRVHRNALERAKLLTA